MIAAGDCQATSAASRVRRRRRRGFDGPIKEDVALSLAFFSDPDGTTLYLAEMKPAYR